MTNLNDIFSYQSLINNRSAFRSKRSTEDYMRKYDEPGFFFWKPIFYFYNDDSFGDSLGNNGLLYPAWCDGEDNDSAEPLADYISTSSSREYSDSDSGFADNAKLTNCAYNYLRRNAEYKRAKLIKNFILLLSDINIKTPWYFKSISGLDEALSRSEFYKSGSVSDERKKITITCLADSVDTRIGMLLDMYKAACFSWQTKREIVPANLRKFDMGIYIFLQPYQNDFNGNYEPKTTKVDGSNLTTEGGLKTHSIKTASHKYIEFHNCEIDIDSCKIGDSFSNEAAQSIEYNIVINYDNCYEDRYGVGYAGIIGDSIITDIVSYEDSSKDTDGTEISRSGYSSLKYGQKYTPDWGYTMPERDLSKEKEVTAQSLLKSKMYNKISGSLLGTAEAELNKGIRNITKAAKKIANPINYVKSPLKELENAAANLTKNTIQTGTAYATNAMNDFYKKAKSTVKETLFGKAIDSVNKANNYLLGVEESKNMIVSYPYARTALDTNMFTGELLVPNTQTSGNGSSTRGIDVNKSAENISEKIFESINGNVSSLPISGEEDIDSMRILDKESSQNSTSSQTDITTERIFQNTNAQTTKINKAKNLSISQSAINNL